MMKVTTFDQEYFILFYFLFFSIYFNFVLGFGESRPTKEMKTWICQLLLYELEWYISSLWANVLINVKGSTLAALRASPERVTRYELHKSSMKIPNGPPLEYTGRTQLYTAIYAKSLNARQLAFNIYRSNYALNNYYKL